MTRSTRKRWRFLYQTDDDDPVLPVLDSDGVQFRAVGEVAD
jgi:hypothetical protein